ncbi:expressed unknown protein [Seminavis robusta]|uniref:Uncharacterized protein n=1 Tax=Seminavis robusta TaxID=568900 RepID=A0A9N8EYV9_9STRA|nr:expressed unknown protein [Seminavis robusta]|eukprot:Sro2148_g316550.1 n/a (881) ;mRNA; r:4341-7071
MGVSSIASWIQFLLVAGQYCNGSRRSCYTYAFASFNDIGRSRAILRDMRLETFGFSRHVRQGRKHPGSTWWHPSVRSTITQRRQSEESSPDYQPEQDHQDRNQQSNESDQSTSKQPLEGQNQSFGKFTESYQEGDYFVWEVGDVEEDLTRLDYSISLDNAEDNLKYQERQEVLDAFAAQRRLLLPDMHRFVTRTLQWSLIFVLLKRFIKHSKADNQLATLVGTRLMTLPWDIHFWAITVLTPIVFLKIKRRVLAPPAPIPSDVQHLPLSYVESSPEIDWENPQTSCRDNVLCLAEQWSSAVTGVAYLGIFQILCRALVRVPAVADIPILRNLRFVPVFSAPLMAAVQFVTRLSAMVSVFQFPKLLFELQRKQQPRPLKMGVAILQQLIGSLLKWGMPVGLASDLSQVLAPLPRRSLIAIYGAAFAFLSAMEMRYNPSRKPSQIPSKTKRERAPLVRFLDIVASLGFSAVVLVASAYIAMLGIFHKPAALPRISWLAVATYGALLFSMIGPFCHLAAFQRIVDIVHTHDLSLTTEPEAMQETLNNPQKRQERYQWRHRLRWREPRRIDTVAGNPWSTFWHWVFISGSIEEKLYQMDEDIREKERNKQDDLLQQANIWKRLEKEKEHEIPGTPPPDRRVWKDAAMKRVAEFHQQDFEANKYTDPLGVAVQQTFGIGLVYMDDHLRPLDKDEQPSTRRLQARAAKSALKRVQELRREAIQKINQLGTGDEDPKEVEAKKTEIVLHVDSEIDRLGKRLAELTPYNDNPDGNATGLQFLGSHGLRAIPGRLVDAENSAIEELMRWYEVEILGLDPPDLSEAASFDNKTNNTKGDSFSNSPGDDSEIAHLRKRFAGSSFVDEDNEQAMNSNSTRKNDPDDMSTILV